MLEPKRFLGKIHPTAYTLIMPLPLREQLAVCSLWLFATLVCCAETHHSNLSLLKLNQRLDEIDNELNQLAKFSLRNGYGSIGYRSQWYEANSHHEWIQIDLGEVVSIDQIVLVPTLWRDTDLGFSADCFPQKFQIRVGTQEDTLGEIVATYESPKDFLPTIAPLFIPTHGIEARWIRLEALELSKRMIDQHYVLQLAEFLVFSNQVNVALRKPVQVPREGLYPNQEAWSPQYLVDGQVPYLMNSAQGEKSLGFITPPGKLPKITFDLGQSYPIDGINLHAIDLANTIPQGFKSGLGIPNHLRIEGANTADFSDAKTILNLNKKRLGDIGNILMWPTGGSEYRYIRIDPAASDSPTSSSKIHNNTRIGFAEVEILSNNQNVALNTPVDFTPAISNQYRAKTPKNITDGRNLYGEILPIYKWLEELARREALERERPLVNAMLKERSLKQEKNLRRLIAFAVTVAVLIIFLIVVIRYRHKIELANLRTRFAADLHDELGANVHTIKLLGDLAESELDSPDLLKHRIGRIRTMAERASQAIRSFTNIANAKELYDNLPEDIRRFTEGILAEIDHEVTIEGESHLQALQPQTKVDLFLFYRECLVNISRHSEATYFSTQLIAKPKSVQLMVSDNGSGITNPKFKKIPPSLKRRARLLKAKVKTEDTESGGTRITLIRKNRKYPSYGRRH